MSQLLTINLSKSPAASWGFRLQGGKDFAQPLCIQKVNVGSVAEGAGLRAGDSIVSIGGNEAVTLRHKEAQDVIVKAGNSFPMVIQRSSLTWKPQVVAAPAPVAQPAAKKAAPQAPKAAAAPASVKAAIPATQKKYNTPINLYSEENISEALSAQSEVLGKGCMGINFSKFDREVKLRTDSPTYRMIHGTDDSEGAFKPHKQLPVAEEEVTPKPVFPAPQPGQKGYYNVNDKTYCDVHAKQAARINPPAPNMVPVTVKPGAAPPVGAFPTAAVRAPAVKSPAVWSPPSA